jgi:spore germination protein GerM
MNTTNRQSRLIAAPLMLMGALLAACSAGVGSAGTVAPRSTPDEGAAATGSPGATASASGQPSGPGATATPRATTPSSNKKIALKVYFPDYLGSDDSAPVLVPAYREVDQTVAVATAAVRQLLAGPTDEERAHNLATGTLGTDIPQGTLLLGITIQNGLATVDLSREFESSASGGDLKSMSYRFAQVVYTVSQFPTVSRVNFRLDGKPIKAINGEARTLDRPATRLDYVALLPAIFVDQPSFGAKRTDPVRVSGMALVFEGQFMAALVVVGPQGDRIVAQRTVHGKCCGHPEGPGLAANFLDFEFTIDVPSSVARNADLHLRVWEPSARDGSPTNVLEYPLR